MSAGLIIDPGGETVVVAITSASAGATISLYSDVNATSALANPLTITTVTKVFVRERTVQALVSLKVGGVEYGTAAGAALPYTFSDEGIGSCSPVVSSEIHQTTSGGTLLATTEYTVAVIPDTQYLSESWPQHFQALADYLAANAAALNLKLILHVGDVVNVGNSTQYTAADAPMQTLRGIGVPFLATPGNHDYDTSTGGNPDRTLTTLWNSHFGTTFYASAAAVPTLKDASKTENCYITTTLGGRPTLVFALEFFPRQAVMTWADGVVTAHPNYDIIVLTHSHLYIDGARVKWDTTDGPGGYTDAYAGDEMWQRYFSHWRNLVAVFNGHHVAGNLAHRYDYGDGGNAVLQQFNNWQESTQGGQGRVVLLTINPVTGSVRRKVYNAALAAFDTTAGYQADLTLGGADVAPGALTNAMGRALFLDGTAANYASCPDAAILETSNPDLIADITMTDWTPGGSGAFVFGKWDSGTTKTYFLSVNPTGSVALFYSLNGSTTLTATSTVAVPFADGQRGLIRASRDATTGNVTFYTALPGQPWTQLGTVVAGTSGSLFSGTAIAIVGELLYVPGGWSLNGYVHRVELRDSASHLRLAECRFDVPWSPRYRDDQANVWSLTGSAYTWRSAPLVNV